MFVDIEDWALHRIIYSFKKRVLDKGAVIFKPQEEIQHLRIVQDGIVDIYVSYQLCRLTFFRLTLKITNLSLKS